MLARVYLRHTAPIRHCVARHYGLSHLSSWSFVNGLVSRPHPEKKRGEDAAFCTPNTIGVADGVGGWARKGIDSGAYSRMLMASCEASLLSNPVERLQEAYDATKVPGSSTACLIHLDPTTPTIHTANLGDSGFMLCRKVEGNWTSIFSSPSQCHYFNCPFQLGHGSRDIPDHADQTSLTVEENDLVLVATDGLIDNLSEEQILTLMTLVSNDVPDGESDETYMEYMAAAVVEVAHEVAKSETRMTPFAISAQEAGYKGTRGGKMDDITVIAALIKHIK